MKQFGRMRAAAAVALVIGMFVLAGCGVEEKGGVQTDTAEADYATGKVQPEILEEQEENVTSQPESAAQGNPTPRTAGDAEEIPISTVGLVKRTQAEWDEITRAERAALEEKVKAADGISEEEAIEIAKKAMETDLGEKAEVLKLHELETEQEKFGWKVYLWDLTDWQEYKDKGEIGYDVQFDNIDQIKELDDIFAYHCMVNAIDGSICGAYSSKGLFGDNDIWYEH